MKKFLIIIFALALYSCDFSKRIDTTAAVKEMRERQVKRVLPQDIVNQVDVWGKDLQVNLEKGRLKSGRTVGDFLKLVIDFGNELFKIKSVVILNFSSNSYSCSCIFIF